MRYRSTRGGVTGQSFADVLLAGLAPDGGLFVPETYPSLSPARLEDLAGASFADAAAAVLPLFIGQDTPHFADTAWDRFAHPATTPLVQMGADDFLLELVHGPTLAFKDVAMQWLGPMFSDGLAKAGRQMTIVCATSGDTGGAAVEAMAGRQATRLCVLHPENRISEVQRRFMTTVAADNVMNLAVRGTFDDCQSLVKAMFADETFRHQVGLGAVNSINWARIIAQTIYYVTSSLTLSRQGGVVHYAVPTGNFGDILAGWVAKRLGAPVGHLIVATNENDILTRCLSTGSYRPDRVVETQSPSMDIQVSSNFERLLFEASGGDADLVRHLMHQLKTEGGFDVPTQVLSTITEEFSAYRVDEEATADKMATVFAQSGRLIDPHTAIGLAAAERGRQAGLQGPIVTLSTAHAAKFPAAVEAATGVAPTLPPHVRDLFGRPEHMISVDAELEAVKGQILHSFAL